MSSLPYEAICDASPDAILLVDTEGRIAYANARVTDMFGYEPDELVDEPIEILVPDGKRDEHVAQRDRYIDDPETRPMGAGLELTATHRDGSTIPIDVSLSPIEHEGTLEIMAAVRDVSVQHSLRRECQTILEAVPDAVVVAAASTGEIVEVNDNVTDLLGYEPAELVGRPQTELHPAGETERYRRLFEHHVAAEQTILTQLPDGSTIYVETKRGERIPVEINAAVFDMGSERLIAGVFRDVTARKESERQLEELHEVTRKLMVADDREEIARLVADAASSILGHSSNVVRLVDGDRLSPVAVTAQAEADMGERPEYSLESEASASRALESGEPLRYEDVREADIDDSGDARSVLYVPMGDHGVVSLVDTTPDAFDRSDEELLAILTSGAETALDRLAYEAELERRNQRLDEFASILAHDLRNPLTVAQGWLDLAPAEESGEWHDQIQGAIDRMDELIDTVLTMVRSGYEVESREPIELGDVVAECWENVETADASLRVDSDGIFYADAHRVRNLFENLFRNAIEHGGAAVTVRTGLTDDGLYVADDGPGIPPEDRERVFDPGWTTGTETTGLGMNIVREIADAHGWDATVGESDAGGARIAFSGVETTLYDDSFE